jgi:regulator of nucleoside diphosphate kinase
MRDTKHDKPHTPSARAARPRRLTRRGEMGSIAAGLHDLHDLPLVHVTTQDYRRLRSLLRAERRGSKAAVLRSLARELDRALVYPATEIPPDAVTLGTRVVFRADAGERLECGALVSDEARSTIGGTVPVLTPLGVALLGLRPGNEMPYLGCDGRLKTVSIKSIVSQPEAPERDLRRRYLPNPYADPALREDPASTHLDRVGSSSSPRPKAGATRKASGRPLALSTQLMQSTVHR